MKRGGSADTANVLNMVAIGQDRTLARPYIKHIDRTSEYHAA